MVNLVWIRELVKGLFDDHVERLEKHAEERWVQNEEDREVREAKHEVQREEVPEDEELEEE